ncbi:hypothetical protein MesoLj113a_41310 [Mesorhizobium sp. 113-1-2]|nr:hypothetical protein MesoLj113a_41310 [Mesorhizobium sp. 113-1-2]
MAGGTLAPEVFLRYSHTVPRAPFWRARDAAGTFDWRMISRPEVSEAEIDPVSQPCARSKVKIMDARTVLILGLGIVILLLLGFCALPS